MYILTNMKRHPPHPTPTRREKQQMPPTLNNDLRQKTYKQMEQSKTKEKRRTKMEKTGIFSNVLNVFWSNSQTLLPKTECLGQITAPINASGRRISSETSGLFLCNSSTAVSWRKQVNNTNKQKTHINNTQPSCPFSTKPLISLVSSCQFGLSILEVCYMQNYQGKKKSK